MATEPKTLTVATYPDGHRIVIRRVSGLGYQWDRSSYSSHKDSAVAQATEAGATITREPNKNHPDNRRRSPKLPTFDRLMRGGK